MDENRGFIRKSKTLGNQSQPFYYLTKHLSVIHIDVPRRWFVKKANASFYVPLFMNSSEMVVILCQT